jgi:hypothetical protein
MHLFIELLVLAAFLVAALDAFRRWGRRGAGFYAAVSLAGFLRESFVALRRVLYDFAPLHLVVGPAPLIAAIIWAFSIHAALVWAERASGERFLARPLAGRPLGGVALFMMALACFYEPFLKLIGMARWEAGTRAAYDVPLIALLGYPSFALLLLGIWAWAARAASAWRLAVRLTAAVAVLAPAHVLLLDALKRRLGW